MIIKAFIINKNRPKVIIVTGSVRITKMGRTMSLKSASTTATIIAET